MEPITLAEAKLFCRIDNTAEDELVLALIAAAQVGMSGKTLDDGIFALENGIPELQEALRVDNDAEDALIQALIVAAREAAEARCRPWFEKIVAGVVDGIKELCYCSIRAGEMPARFLDLTKKH